MGVGLVAAAILDRIGFGGFTLCFGAAVALQITAATLLGQLKKIPSGGGRGHSNQPSQALPKLPQCTLTTALCLS